MSVQDLLEKLADDLYKMLQDELGVLPSAEVYTGAATSCLTEIAALLNERYTKQLISEAAEFLGLAADASAARVEVAMEDRAKELGSMEAVRLELNRKLDEKYPPKKTIVPNPLTDVLN